MEKKSNGESDVNGKWDACIDLTARRVVCSSLGGAFAGLLFFRSPVTRWASTAFGAGIGIGSAYADCSRFFDSSSSATSPSIGSAYADCSCLFCFTPLTVCGNPYCIGFLDHFLSSHFLENNIGS
ncbi:BnaC07g13650D [Brassica napus]|uniref:BnaC07g13650D protein n=1 Tax=Brassica napus TaxID=3708 RepID=A0A078FDU9_BRANA|nr:BnaC07g13650D [Brassica napus]